MTIAGCASFSPSRTSACTLHKRRQLPFTHFRPRCQKKLYFCLKIFCRQLFPSHFSHMHRFFTVDRCSFFCADATQAGKAWKSPSVPSAGCSFLKPTPGVSLAWFQLAGSSVQSRGCSAKQKRTAVETKRCPVKVTCGGSISHMLAESFIGLAKRSRHLQSTSPLRCTASNMLCAELHASSSSSNQFRPVLPVRGDGNAESWERFLINRFIGARSFTLCLVLPEPEG